MRISTFNRGLLALRFYIFFVGILLFGAPARGFLPECRITITKISEEFKTGTDGFVKTLTELANANGRNFHRRGGARAFLLELAELLPLEVRDLAIQELNRINILDYDANNSRKNVIAMGRLLTGFRAICAAWNRVPGNEQIPLHDLFLPEASRAALRILKFDEALKRIAARPDLDVFQNRDTGSLIELQDLAGRHRIEFTRKFGARQVLENLFAGLPPETPAEEKIEIARQIAEILEFDGGNAFLQREAADRILNPLKRIARAHKIDDSLMHVKDHCGIALSTMNAEELLATDVEKALRPDGMISFLRNFARSQRIPFASEYSTRDFLVKIANALPQSVREETSAKIQQLPWKKEDGTTAFRRGGEAAADRIITSWKYIAEAWNQSQTTDATKIEIKNQLQETTCQQLLEYLDLSTPVPKPPPCPNPTPPLPPKPLVPVVAKMSPAGPVLSATNVRTRIPLLVIAVPSVSPKSDGFPNRPAYPPNVVRALDLFMGDGLRDSGKVATAVGTLTEHYQLDRLKAPPEIALELSHHLAKLEDTPENYLVRDAITDTMIVLGRADNPAVSQLVITDLTSNVDNRRMTALQWLKELELKDFTQPMVSQRVKELRIMELPETITGPIKAFAKTMGNGNKREINFAATYRSIANAITADPTLLSLDDHFPPATPLTAIEALSRTKVKQFTHSLKELQKFDPTAADAKETIKPVVRNVLLAHAQLKSYMDSRARERWESIRLVGEISINP